MKRGSRARSEKAQGTRNEILRASLRLFQEKGFHQTTMRDIASAASLSVGASYYYFRTKDELVLAFYEQTGAEAREHNKAIIDETKDFRTRFAKLLRFKFSQLRPYRSFIGVIAGSAADPASPLSPFSAETKAIRDEAIRLIEEVIDGSTLKSAETIKPHLPRLLWLYQMSLIFYWIHDRSPEQKRTDELMEQSLGIIMLLLKISRLPLMAPVNRSVIKLLAYFDAPFTEQPS